MKGMWVLVLILVIIIVALVWVIFAPSAQAPTIPEDKTPVATSSPTEPVDEEPGPLHERVVITSPKSGASVGRSFEVKGEAPGPWYFEASFPIMVRDKDDNVIGRAHGSAQGEWMTEDQVPYEATVNIDSEYKGPATLILMKDNPSGLPEHDDSIEIPIVIQ